MFSVSLFLADTCSNVVCLGVWWFRQGIFAMHRIIAAFDSAFLFLSAPPADQANRTSRSTPASRAPSGHTSTCSSPGTRLMTGRGSFSSSGPGLKGLGYHSPGQPLGQGPLGSPLDSHLSSSHNRMPLLHRIITKNTEA